MAEQPKQHILSDKEDVVYFYENAIAHRGIALENRKEINKLSRKKGFEIRFLDSGECKESISKPNEITIYDSSKGKNQKFFRHLRNAFSHCYIEIGSDRCKFLDWDAFGKNGKKCEYEVKRITMTGDVDFNSFKTVLDEFFDDKSILKSKNNKEKKDK